MLKRFSVNVTVHPCTETIYGFTGAIHSNIFFFFISVRVEYNSVALHMVFVVTCPKIIRLFCCVVSFLLSVLFLSPPSLFLTYCI